MEPVFQVTSTGVIDSETCKLSNGNGISITAAPDEEDVSNTCTYIINLPTALNHHFESGTLGGEKEEDSQITVELKHASDVTFTELTDLDNGIVTKVDGNSVNEITLEGGQIDTGSAEGSEESVSGILPSNAIFRPTEIDFNDIKVEEGQNGHFTISLNGDSICASSDLLKLIHQEIPGDCVEVQGIADQSEISISMEEEMEESSASVGVMEESCLNVEQKVDVAIVKTEANVPVDHCNNEPVPTLIRKPMRTYSRKSKTGTQQSSQVTTEPATTRTTVPTPSPPNNTSPVDVKPLPAPSLPALKPRRRASSVRILDSQKLSILIPTKKRKLIIDSQRQINNVDFKKQLVETGDILHSRQADLGPSTKKALKCMESGGVAQFFTSPGRPIKNVPLSKLYYTKLVVDVESSNRKQKEASPSQKIEPLDPDLRVLSADAEIDLPDHTEDCKNESDKARKRNNSSKQKVHSGKLPVLSLEAEFKSFKFNKPSVFKEYSSVRWKPAISSEEPPTKSYSKLKRNQELRKQRQAAINKTQVSTNDQTLSNESATTEVPAIPSSLPVEEDNPASIEQSKECSKTDEISLNSTSTTDGVGGKKKNSKKNAKSIVKIEDKTTKASCQMEFILPTTSSNDEQQTLPAPTVDLVQEAACFVAVVPCEKS